MLICHWVVKLCELAGAAVTKVLPPFVAYWDYMLGHTGLTDYQV